MSFQEYFWSPLTLKGVFQAALYLEVNSSYYKVAQKKHWLKLNVDKSGSALGIYKHILVCKIIMKSYL